MKNIPLEHTFIAAKVSSEKLMIILHGRGDSAEGFAFLPSYLQLEEMNYLLLNAPYEYFGGYSWYDLPPNQIQGIAYSSGLLAQSLDVLFEEEFDAKQSFLLGFSQGSLLTFEFGARYEKLLAGYIAISGYVYDTELLLEEMNPLHQTSQDWLCTHGTEDDVLPFSISKSQVEVLQEGGFDITFESYEKPHTLIEEELVMIRHWIKERMNED